MKFLCGNVSGNISSTKTGDTSNPAERGSPVDELRAACGDAPGLNAVIRAAVLAATLMAEKAAAITAETTTNARTDSSRAVR